MTQRERSLIFPLLMVGWGFWLITWGVSIERADGGLVPQVLLLLIGVMTWEFFKGGDARR